jgi:hypothetical protein
MNRPPAKEYEDLLRKERFFA